MPKKGHFASLESRKRMSIAQLNRRRKERGGRYVDPKKPRTTKVCPKCLKRKLIRYFSKNKFRYDGFNGWCKKCMKKGTKKYLPAKRKSNKRAYAALRLETLQYYSGKEKPECKCCAVDFLEFLSIDHINGGGSEDKRKIGTGGKFYKWLKKNNYPKGFRVLCHNCNQSLGAYGYCPHRNLE